MSESEPITNYLQQVGGRYNNTTADTPGAIGLTANQYKTYQQGQNSDSLKAALGYDPTNPNPVGGALETPESKAASDAAGAATQAQLKAEQAALGNPYAPSPGSQSISGQNGYNNNTINPAGAEPLTPNTLMSNGAGTDSTGKKYQDIFGALKASGTPAPATMGAAGAAISSATPPPTPPLYNPAKADAVLSADQAHQQYINDYNAYNVSSAQNETLSQEYTRLSAEAGLPALNTKLLNMKKIIDGTEDDIRSEIQKVNGFATESQVLALSNARNKTMIQNYNNLVQTRQDAINNINTMIGLTKEDRAYALQQLDQKLNFDQQQIQFAEKALANAQNTLQNTATAQGWDTVYRAAVASGDVNAIARINSTMGPGFDLATMASVDKAARDAALWKTQQEQLKADADLAKTKADAAKTAADAEKAGQFNLSPGENRYDAEGKLIATGAEKPTEHSAIYKEYQDAVASGYKGDFIKYQNEDANRKAKASGGSNGLLGGFTQAQINTTVNQIAGAFDNEAIVKNFNVINEGYQFAKSLSNNTKNPADDQGLIYAFAKAMDPGSVVREGEYATAQKYAQSLVQSYGKSVTQALNGTGFLSEDARKNIKKTIESKFQASKTNYDNVYKNYQTRINDAKSGKGNSLTDYSTAYTNTPTNTKKVLTPAEIPSGYYQASDGKLYKK